MGYFKTSRSKAFPHSTAGGGKSSVVWLNSHRQCSHLCGVESVSSKNQPWWSVIDPLPPASMSPPSLHRLGTVITTCPDSYNKATHNWFELQWWFNFLCHVNTATNRLCIAQWWRGNLNWQLQLEGEKYITWCFTFWIIGKTASKFSIIKFRQSAGIKNDFLLIANQRIWWKEQWSLCRKIFIMTTTLPIIINCFHQ